MPRGKNNHSPRGGGAPNRGGFNGRGRGRGRGRGGFVPSEGAGRGRGRGGYIPMDVIEQSVQVYTEDPPNGYPSHFNSPRGRGRGGSGYNSPRSGFSTPGRGTYTPRGRGRGGPLPIHPALEDIAGATRGGFSSFSPRGRRGGSGRGGKELASKLRGGAPLSKVLYEDRPFLRPIKFVRGVHTATLFKDEEELIQPIQEAAGDTEASHVPTADKIANIFSGDVEREAEEDDQSGEEELEEIDFSEIGRIQAQVDAAAASKPAESSRAGSTRPEGQFTGFWVDTTPTNPSASASSIAVERVSGVLGDEEDEEEVIVYVAPHPRAGPVTPPFKDTIAEPVPQVSILTGLIPSLAVGDSKTDSDPNPALREEHALIPATESTPVAHIGQSQSESVSTAVPAVEAVQPPDPESLPPPPPAFLSIKASEATVEPADNAVDQPVPQEPATQDVIMEVQGLHVQEPATVEDSHTSAIPIPPTFDSVSFSVVGTPTKKQTRRLRPVKTRSLITKRRGARRKSLRSFGALVSEGYEAGGRERDPRRDEQRRGDSDVDWGDESDEEVTGNGMSVGVGVDQISDGLGGMDLDSDLDMKAMLGFVHSMSAEGSRQVTMDDLADMALIKQEDQDGEEDEDEDEVSEDDEDSEEDDELEAVVQAEERALTGDGAALGLDGEDEDEDESSEEDEDEDETPRKSFRARLEKMRSKVKGKQRALADPEDDDEDEDDDDDDFDMQLDSSWAENDESYLAHIQDMLDDNAEMLSSKDRKTRNKLFRAIQDGALDLDDYEEMMGQPAKRKKDKYKDLPPELREQWEKDREKKADNKRKRALARLEAAADPLAKKKGGKKGMKDMLKVARMDVEIEIPHRIVNLVTLEREIRRFLENIGGPKSMALPPADKATRKRIHELANAFHLKSDSKGKGDKRYTTLIKTTLSGINVNEKKVRRILREVDKNWGAPERRGDRVHATSLNKHREGEEVGKSAPKIGESNVGFKMLAAMGWAEGDKIGLSGGLDVPLVAVMKKTKLGLGATL